VIPNRFWSSGVWCLRTETVSESPQGLNADATGTTASAFAGHATLNTDKEIIQRIWTSLHAEILLQSPNMSASSLHNVQDFAVDWRSLQTWRSSSVMSLSLPHPYPIWEKLWNFRSGVILTWRCNGHAGLKWLTHRSKHHSRFMVQISYFSLNIYYSHTSMFCPKIAHGPLIPCSRLVHETGRNEVRQVTSPFNIAGRGANESRLSWGSLGVPRPANKQLGSCESVWSVILGHEVINVKRLQPLQKAGQTRGVEHT
jgi:hypothetical protein